MRKRLPDKDIDVWMGMGHTILHGCPHCRHFTEVPPKVKYLPLDRINPRLLEALRRENEVEPGLYEHWLLWLECEGCRKPLVEFWDDEIALMWGPWRRAGYAIRAKFPSRIVVGGEWYPIQRE